MSFVLGIVACSPLGGGSPTGGPPSALQALADENAGGGTGLILAYANAGTTTTAAAGADGDGNPVRPDGAWWVGSVAKMVTATAVFQLVDEGLVHLDSSASDYLDVSVSDAFTIRQLLQFQSGVPQTSSHISQCPSAGLATRAFDLAVEPAFTPGERFEYSNTNFVLLGQLIQDVTGDDPAVVMRERIFEPLDMDNTYFWDSEMGVEVFSPHPSDADTPAPGACDLLDATVGTDGWLVSNAADLSRFQNALYGGELISDESLAEMTDVSADLAEEEDFGLGVVAETDADHPGITLYGFSGTPPGQTTVVMHDPGTDISVVVRIGFGQAMDLAWDAYDLAVEEQ
jgi:D-alanyl-D-alanine carboxypeptidase